MLRGFISTGITPKPQLVMIDRPPYLSYLTAQKPPSPSLIINVCIVKAYGQTLVQCGKDKLLQKMVAENGWMIKKSKKRKKIKSC